jgi:hypothetical protein
MIYDWRFGSRVCLTSKECHEGFLGFGDVFGFEFEIAIRRAVLIPGKIAPQGENCWTV